MPCTCVVECTQVSGQYFFTCRCGYTLLHRVNNQTLAKVYLCCAGREGGREGG